VVNNTLSIAQQYYITRHVIGDNPEPPKDNGKPGLMGRLAAMAEKANKNQGAAASAALPAASQAASDATEGASNDASDTTTDPAADQSANSGDSSAAGGTPVRKRKKKGKKGGKGGKR
jgi:hypothetical protein